MHFGQREKLILLFVIACGICMSYLPLSAFIDIGVLSNMEFLSLQVSGSCKYCRVSNSGSGKVRVYKLFL